MSKSVDDTVVDFFRLLLVENGAPIETFEPSTVLADAKSPISSVPRQFDASRKLATNALIHESADPVLEASDKAEANRLNVSLQSTARQKLEFARDFGISPSQVELGYQLKNAHQTELTHERHTSLGSDEVSVQFKPAPTLDKAALEKLLQPVFDVNNRAAVSTASKTVIQSNLDVEVQAKLKGKVKADDNIDAKVEVQSQLPEVVNKAEWVTENSHRDTKILPVAEAVTHQTLKSQTGAAPPSITKDLQVQLDDEFQVLFFKVAGLTLAVPLVSLGGIVKVERINHIFGRPSWFLGVQTHRDVQLNLVNTCAWVMPEKYDEKLAQTINYQYLVLLEGSNWGLACESLVNAVKIKQSEVNWRASAGKRPWLAGVVKEHMCGILNVKALILLLDAGLGCQDPIN